MASSIETLKSLDLPAGLEHKILFEPEVTLLAKTDICNQTLLASIYGEDYELGNESGNSPSFTKKEDGDYHQDGEYLVEFAGRSCYQSFGNPAGRTTAGYIENIVNQRHFSVLEHANVTFYIEAVSRALTHELIRHRHLSYSQLSQRYVNASDSRYVCPPLYRQSKQLFWEWIGGITDVLPRTERLVSQSESKYSNLPRKVHREAARAILPNCVETKIVVTGNLRAWREFLEKRWNDHADREIQEVAGLIAEELKALYPSVYNDIHYGD